MSIRYIKLAKHVTTYRFNGKLYTAGKVYKVDEDTAETLLEKVNDQSLPYFKPARRSETEGAVAPGRSDSRNNLRSQAPVAAADPEDDEEDEDDEGESAPTPAKPKKAAKPKKTVRLKGGKVQPPADEEEVVDNDDDDDSGAAVQV